MREQQVEDSTKRIDIRALIVRTGQQLRRDKGIISWQSVYRKNILAKRGDVGGLPEIQWRRPRGKQDRYPRRVFCIAYQDGCRIKVARQHVQTMQTRHDTAELRAPVERGLYTQPFGPLLPAQQQF